MLRRILSIAPVMLFVILPILNAMIFPPLFIYVIIVVVSLTSGVYAAYSRENDLLANATLTTALYAIVFSINSMIITVIQLLSGKLETIADKGVQTVSMFNADMIDPNIAFYIAYVLFIIPVLLKFTKTNESRFYYLAAPVLLYLILSFLFGYVASNLVGL